MDFTTVAGDQSVSRTLEYACGAPWRTQQHVRDVMTKLSDNTLAGLCGHDDCGQMSVWYVSSALGFYPFDPTTGVYVLGSPLVESATLHLQPGFAAGKEFKIVAHHNSPKMGPEPNVTWGAAEGDRP